MTARNWDNFLKRLPTTTPLPHLHIDYSDGAFAPDIMLQHRSAYVLAGEPSHHTQQPNQHRPNSLHHKRQRTDPTFPRYTAPFPITLPTTVKAAVFTEDGRPRPPPAAAPSTTTHC